VYSKARIVSSESRMRRPRNFYGGHKFLSFVCSNDKMISPLSLKEIAECCLLFLFLCFPRFLQGSQFSSLLRCVITASGFPVVSVALSYFCFAVSLLFFMCHSFPLFVFFCFTVSFSIYDAHRCPSLSQCAITTFLW
jgi:hypothetical protein